MRGPREMWMKSIFNEEGVASLYAKEAPTLGWVDMYGPAVEMWDECRACLQDMVTQGLG